MNKIALAILALMVTDCTVFAADIPTPVPPPQLEGLWQGTISQSSCQDPQYATGQIVKVRFVKTAVNRINCQTRGDCKVTIVSGAVTFSDGQKNYNYSIATNGTVYYNDNNLNAAAFGYYNGKAYTINGTYYPTDNHFELTGTVACTGGSTNIIFNLNKS